MQERYDIIGDVHGCLDAPRRLLTLGNHDEALRGILARTPL